MNCDIDEYLQQSDDKRKEESSIFIDEELVKKLIRRPHQQGTGGAYWSIYKIGKNPNVFKDPKLKEENLGIGTGEVFVDYENYFETHNSLSTFDENEL